MLSLVAHEVLGVVHWAMPADQPAPADKREKPEHLTRVDYRRPSWLDRG